VRVLAADDEMWLRCRIELVLAVFVTFQVAMFLVTIFVPVWNSASYHHDSSDDDDTTNETVKLGNFLAEYETYCRSQLIPKASVITNATVGSRQLCPCVPDTLGKCLYLIRVMQMKYFHK